MESIVQEYHLLRGPGGKAKIIGTPEGSIVSRKGWESVKKAANIGALENFSRQREWILIVCE